MLALYTLDRTLWKHMKIMDTVYSYIIISYKSALEFVLFVRHCRRCAY